MVVLHEKEKGWKVKDEYIQRGRYQKECSVASSPRVLKREGRYMYVYTNNYV